MTFHWDNPYLSSIVRCLKTVTVTVAKNEREKEIDRLLVVFLFTMLFGWVHAIYSHKIIPYDVVDSEQFEERFGANWKYFFRQERKKFGKFCGCFREGT